MSTSGPAACSNAFDQSLKNRRPRVFSGLPKAGGGLAALVTVFLKPVS